MPCRDYYDPPYYTPDPSDVRASKVACLLEEISTGVPVNSKSPYWLSGAHPEVCGIGKKRRDAMVARLCSMCQKIDVTKYSLELQIWWRDHQEEDKARLAAEAKEADLKKQKEAALAKLTPYEQQLLGLK